MFKKGISIIVAACLLIGAVTLSACTSGDKNGSESNKKISIVTTIFPEYDWVKTVLGDNAENAEITMLLDNGIDLHNYEPTADDLIKISKCDLFIYVGGESDDWVDDAIASSPNPDINTINILESLGEKIKEEEIVEGMQAEEEEGEDPAEEEPEYDEHVWLSLKNAQAVVSLIADELGKIDSENAQLYLDNAKAYNAQLAELDAQYQECVDASPTKTLLFGDRFPFRYLTDDYGITYYAAFVGCSAETEASFETITFLADKVDELNLKHVMVIEGSDQKIANSIIENSTAKDAGILVLDSMQSSTSADIENGKTYYSVMQQNLEVLKEALA